MIPRFVVLSLARSGTSLLNSTLRTHPAILTHGEIFHPDPKWHLQGSFQGMSVEEMRAWQQRPDFLQAVFAQDRPIVGFKMWRSQNAAVCDQLMEDASIAKIVYARDNGLAQFSSLELARQTGIWNQDAGSKASLREVPKLRFDPQVLAQFLERRDHMFGLYRQRSKGAVLDLSYNQIAGGDFSRVLDFLGAEPMALQPQKKKLHSSDILSRYDAQDHDAIRAFLAEIGQEGWVAE